MKSIILKWHSPEEKPEVCKPILMIVFNCEYVSGYYMGNDQWDSVGIAFYETSYITKWTYLPEIKSQGD